MTPQDLREELLQREAYALGYRNGSADVIAAFAKKLQEETDLQNLKTSEKKEE